MSSSCTVSKILEPQILRDAWADEVGPSNFNTAILKKIHTWCQKESPMNCLQYCERTSLRRTLGEAIKKVNNPKVNNSQSSPDLMFSALFSDLTLEKLDKDDLSKLLTTLLKKPNLFGTAETSILLKLLESDTLSPEGRLAALSRALRDHNCKAIQSIHAKGQLSPDQFNGAVKERPWSSYPEQVKQCLDQLNSEFNWPNEFSALSGGAQLTPELNYFKSLKELVAFYQFFAELGNERAMNAYETAVKMPNTPISSEDLRIVRRTYDQARDLRAAQIKHYMKFGKAEGLPAPAKKELERLISKQLHTKDDAPPPSTTNPVISDLISYYENGCPNKELVDKELTAIFQTDGKSDPKKEPDCQSSLNLTELALKQQNLAALLKYREYLKDVRRIAGANSTELEKIDQGTELLKKEYNLLKETDKLIQTEKAECLEKVKREAKLLKKKEDCLKYGCTSSSSEEVQKEKVDL